MKKTIFLAFLSLVFLLLTACSGDSKAAIGSKKEFKLDELASSGISGTVTFEKTSETETKVTIALKGTAEDKSYPAHIHEGNVGSGGGTKVDIGPVTGVASGSTTNFIKKFSKDKNGNDFSYDDLLDYDGYVNIHSPEDSSKILASGEVGK